MRRASCRPARMPAGEPSVERPYPWRVLEDGAEATPPPRPAPAGPPVPGGAPATPGPEVTRRMLGLAAAAAAALLVGAVAIVLGGSSPPALVLPGASAPPMEMSRLAEGTMPGASPASAPGAAAGTADASLLVIDVAGAVRRPGVYRLPDGSRVVDAIAAAGGYGPRVDADAAGRLNLAAPLRDGEQVRVPSRDDPPSERATTPAAAGGSGTTGSGGSARGPVDLNTASADELDTLPGIGPVTAAKIIAAREEAPFATVGDLRSRGVVGEATFRKLESLVTVGP